MRYSAEVIELFKERWKADKFVGRLRDLLQENNIKEIELAEIIGVSDQTITNWFSKSGANKPQWIEYMYKLNMYLFSQIEDYSPIDLYFDVFSIGKGSKEYDLRVAEDLRKKRLAQQQVYYDRLVAFNDKFKNGVMFDIDFSNLLANSNFYAIISNINEKYCKLPPNERNKGWGPNSVLALKDSLFNCVTDFLFKFNEKQENKNSNKQS